MFVRENFALLSVLLYVVSQQSGLFAQEPIFLPPKKATPTHVLPALTPSEPVEKIASAPEIVPTKLLSTAVMREVNQVLLPSMGENADGVFLSSFLTMSSKLDAQKLAAVDQQVKANGGNLKTHYVDLLIQAIQNDQQLAVPKLKIDGVEFLQSAINSHLEKELAALKEFDLMRDPLTLPVKWRASENLFEDAYVWNQRMKINSKLAEYSLGLQTNLQEFATKSNQPELVSRMQPTIAIHKAVKDTFISLVEREAELRIEEVTRASEVLKSGEVQEERIYAAMALASHEQALKRFFEDTESAELTRPALQDERLQKNCEDLVESGKRADQPLFNKSMLLRDGLHWWLRGRYGAGPMADGLLKDASAIQSKEAMQGLYMPRQKPTTIGKPLDDAVAPGYDRRHYYTWAVESQGLVKNFSEILNPDARGEQILFENLKGDSIWSASIFGEETETAVQSAEVTQRYMQNIGRNTLPTRIVGSYEYVNSIGALEQLVKLSTDEELRAYDAYLSNRPEFSFYNGANKKFEGRPDLSGAAKLDKDRFEIQFKKEGLSWIMALARIELGAILSLHGKTKQPFETVAIQEFDSEPFVEILTDDAVAHIKSLANEPGFLRVTERSHRADSWTLAYLRRIKLIRDMLKTISNVGGSEVSVEIEPYQQELNQYQDRLVSQIQREIARSIPPSPTGAAASSAGGAASSSTGASGGSGTRSFPSSSSPSTRPTSTITQCEGFININFDISTLLGQ